MQCASIATALLLLLSAATAARVRRDALPLSELHAGNDASRHATHGYVYMTEQGRLQIGHGKAGHSSNSGEQGTGINHHSRCSIGLQPLCSRMYGATSIPSTAFPVCICQEA